MMKFRGLEGADVLGEGASDAHDRKVRDARPLPGSPNVGTPGKKVPEPNVVCHAKSFTDLRMMKVSVDQQDLPRTFFGYCEREPCRNEGSPFPNTGATHQNGSRLRPVRTCEEMFINA